ncbi:helix-turn-helix domain-containing protein [Streptomyces sp. NPDC021622]|uniref:helix-turn-helix domain-containing protein n=1 Tax=Streptomyces sp. NPDC021622 TaxID=3155013 RepID=UPI0033E7A5F6
MLEKSLTKGSLDGTPAPALRGLVLGYRAFRFGERIPRRWLVAPDGVVKVILGFGGPLRLTDAVVEEPAVCATSIVSGIGATATVGEPLGPVCGVTLMLTPVAAYRLLGVPKQGPDGRNVDLVDLFGPQVERLIGKLMEFTDWGARFALLDKVLAGRLLVGPASAPEVIQAWRKLQRTAGRTPVRQLATEVGWSRRQLERRFLEQVGLPPKSLAQVLRLQEALRQRAGGLAWAEAAAVAGYHDQSHFARSFKAMVGCTPSSFFETHQAGIGRDGPLELLPQKETSKAAPRRDSAGVAFVQDPSGGRGDAMKRQTTGSFPRSSLSMRSRLNPAGPTSRTT